MKSLQDLFLIGMDRTIPDILPWNEKGIVLNLGCGKKKIDGAVNMDYPDWDANMDYLGFEDESVDCVHAYHFLEHIDDPIAMLRDIQRVLKVGGVCNIVVPYYTSQMQAHDLSHQHMFCEETWRNLFTAPYYTKDREGWKLRVHLNVIMGVVERNLCLVTQLVKE